MTARENFLGAAQAVSELVDRVENWEEEGLGVWTVRELVGHTSRALITTTTYLQQTAEREDIKTPEAYLAGIKNTPAAQIAERGRQAARDLGEDPASTFRTLVQEAEDQISASDDEKLIPTIAGGMRLSQYLPTRTFELVVHGGDLARATGQRLTLPPGAVAEAAALAGRVAVLQGRGPELLAALTGRQPLPEGFSLL